MRRVAACLVLVALVAVPAAHADGDPASDYLLVEKAFLPYDVKFPAKPQAQFVGLVNAANAAGFKIRVALIASDYDMGSVTSLWQKPHTYARFLAEEISFLYKQRLLVVMPNGFGFNWAGHPSTAEYALLATIPIRPGPLGMLAAAQTAVQRLAAASGVKVAPPAHVTTPAQRNAHDRLVIILGSVALLGAAALLRFALRRRR